MRKVWLCFFSQRILEISSLGERKTKRLFSTGFENISLIRDESFVMKYMWTRLLEGHVFERIYKSKSFASYQCVILIFK